MIDVMKNRNNAAALMKIKNSKMDLSDKANNALSIYFNDMNYGSLNPDKSYLDVVAYNRRM